MIQCNRRLHHRRRLGIKLLLSSIFQGTQIHTVIV